VSSKEFDDLKQYDEDGCCDKSDSKCSNKNIA
jgi:hypothetical protein